MDFGNFHLLGFGYDQWMVVNLILLSWPWVTFCSYGFVKKKIAFTLLGLGLFLLFVKEWVTIVFGYTDLNFTEIVFWEIIFFFAFFWIVSVIYQKWILSGNEYLFSVESQTIPKFPSPSTQSVEFPSSRNAFTSPFTVFGGALFVFSLIVSLSVIRNESLQVVVSAIFFSVLVFSVEKKVYRWKSQGVHPGSAWTRPQVIFPFRTFYLVFALGVWLATLMKTMALFQSIQFLFTPSQVLLTLTCFKTLAIIVLYWFFYRLLNQDHLVRKQFNVTAISPQENDHDPGHSETDPEEPTLNRTAKKSRKNFFVRILKKIKERSFRTSLFLSTKRKENIIAKIKEEKIKIDNNAKVIDAFPVVGNRKRDKIKYRIKQLFTDQIQNSLCLIKNVGKQGKFFVFNQIHQDHSLYAETHSDLFKLFDSDLPEKKVSAFVNNWYQTWNHPSSHGSCQFLAMEFNPDNHQLSYYNVGTPHVYHYQSKHNIFSPFRVHRSQVHSNKSTSPLLSKPTHVLTHPHDLIVIFSQDLPHIKDRHDNKIGIEKLLDIVKKHRRRKLENMITSLENEINAFAYATVKNQQTIFIAKISR